MSSNVCIQISVLLVFFLIFVAGNTDEVARVLFGCFPNGTATDYTIPLETQGTCREHCRTLGKFYAGTDVNNCSCTNHLNFNTQQPMEHCSNMTENNETQVQLIYLSFGGFYFSQERSFLDLSKQIPPYTYIACIEFCRGQDFFYAIHVQQESCFCANNHSKDDLTLSKTGLEIVNFTAYFIEFTPISAGDCRKLYDSIRIRYHGYYYINDSGSTNPVQKIHCNFYDETKCVHGWIGNKGVCYHFSEHRIIANDHSSYCRNLDSDVVSVLTFEEQTFLASSVRGFSDWKNDEWGLGLLDTTGTGIYVWNDGFIPTYNGFYVGFPQADNMKCVHGHPQKNNQWIDIYCSHIFKVICKKIIGKRGCFQLAGHWNPDETYTHNDMDLTSCVEICRNKTYLFAAINTPSCHCFNTIPAGEFILWNNCSKTCAVETGQICGSDSPEVIFIINIDHKITPPNCNDLNTFEVTKIAIESSVTPATLKPSLVHCLEGSAVCPRFWFSFLGNCYKLSTTPRHPMAANLLCNTYNSVVLPLSTRAKEIHFMSSFMKQPLTPKYFSWYLGIVNGALAEMFRWTNGKVVNYTNWKKIRRKNFGAYDVKNHQWILLNLDSITRFICEKDGSLLGCYETPGEQPAIEAYVDMTITVCVEFCRGLNKSYAMASNETCYCRDELPSKQTYPSTCDTNCPGQLGQFCGTAGKVSVWAIEKYPPFALSCDDIFEQGIHVSGSYIIDGQLTTCNFSGNGTCKDDWLHFRGHCYFLIRNRGLIPDTAAAECRNHEAALTSVRDWQEHQFLKKAVNGLYSMSSTDGVIIGGSDSVPMVTFTWSDGLLFYDSFPVSQILGINQTRLYMSKVDHYQYRMIDPGQISTAICKLDTDHLGCFNKSSSSSMVAVLESFNSMSITLCRQLCLGQDKLFALVNIDTCLCADDEQFSSLEPVSKSLCHNTCGVNTLQVCGGTDEVSVYRTDPTNIAFNCSQLYSNGIFYEATYKVNVSGGDLASSVTCGFADNTSCQAGWPGKNGTCYRFIPFHLEDMKAFCLDEEALLVVPVDSVQLDFVRNIMLTMPHFNEHVPFWLTGFGSLFNNKYLTLSSGRMLKMDSVTYEPGLTHCIVFENKSIVGKHSCTNISFICEKSEKDHLNCISPSTSPAATLLGKRYMSATQCIQFCQGRDARFAGVHQQDCYCYNELVGRPANISQCSVACSLFDNQLCGSNSGQQSIYNLDHYQNNTAESCAELFNYGATESEWYYIQPPGFSRRQRVKCFVEASFQKEVSLPNSAFSASSFKVGYEPHKARITLLRNSTKAWMFQNSFTNNWIQIVLSSLYFVSGIQTQGMPAHGYVSSYKLSYSKDGTIWAQYNHSADVLQQNKIKANSDEYQMHSVYFGQKFVAKYLKLTILDWEGDGALRVQVLGEDIWKLNFSEYLIGCYLNSQTSQFVKMVSSSVHGLSCSELCGRDYPLFGLHLGENDTCKCGKQVGKEGFLTNSSCSTICSTDPWLCEQNRTLDVYRTAKHCPDPQRIVHGTGDSTRDAYNSTIVYNCSEKSMFPDRTLSTSITCQQDMTWDQTVPECIEQLCVQLSDIPNAVLQYINSTLAIYTCDWGFYSPDGSKKQRLLCGSRMTWIPPQGSCRKFLMRKAVSSKVTVGTKINHQMKSIQTNSIIECMSRCMESIKCARISFSKRNNADGNCLLSTEDSSESEAEADSGWKTYTLDINGI